MLRSFLKPAILLGFCAIGAGCTTKGIYASAYEAHVVDVAVQYQNRSIPAKVAPTLRSGLLGRFAALPKNGRGKCVLVSIQDYHLKNAALSLLVGDANRMTGVVQSVDLQTGQLDGKQQVVALDAAAVNGVLGAVQAAVQQPDDVGFALTSEFNNKVVAAIYGSEVEQRTPRYAEIQPPPESSGLPPLGVTDGVVTGAIPAREAPAPSACDGALNRSS